MRRRLILAVAALALTLAAPGAWAQKAEKFLIFFHEWSAEIDPAARDVVDAAAAFAKANPSMRVDIMGFASNDGGQQANLYMSLVRAQRVFDMLSATGVDAARLSRVGEGAVSTVGTALEGRRVEIVIGAP